MNKIQEYEIEKFYEQNDIFALIEKFEKDFNEKHNFRLYTALKIFDTFSFENQKGFLQYLQQCVCDYGYSHEASSLKDFQDGKVNCYIATILGATILKMAKINFGIVYIESHLFLVAQLQDGKLYALDFTPPFGYGYFKKLTQNHFGKPSDYNKILKIINSIPNGSLSSTFVNSKHKKIECDIYGKDGIFRFVLLNIYENELDREEKVKILKKILDFFPDDEEIFGALGYEFFKIKKYEESLKYYSQIKENHFENFFNLGEVFLKLGNEKKSKFYFQKYLKIGTDKKLLERAKKMVEKI